MKYLIKVYGDRNQRVRLIIARGAWRYALNEARHWDVDRGFELLWLLGEKREVRS